jgi:hypothetical protein
VHLLDKKNIMLIKMQGKTTIKIVDDMRVFFSNES